MPLALGLLKQRRRARTCEKHMHAAGRSAEAVQKFANEIGAVQRRFANSRSRSDDAAVAPHEVAKLAPQPCFEQSHSNSRKSVTLWLRH